MKLFILKKHGRVGGIEADAEEEQERSIPSWD